MASGGVDVKHGALSTSVLGLRLIHHDERAILLSRIL